MATAWAWDKAIAPAIEAPLFDAGVLPAGAVVSRPIAIRNTGSRAVELWTTDASCRCARLECSARVIPSRGECRGTVTLNLSEVDLDGNLRVELRGYDRAGRQVLSLPVRATIQQAADSTRIATTSSTSVLAKEEQ
jgi:hypothetical protein